MEDLLKHHTESRQRKVDSKKVQLFAARSFLPLESLDTGSSSLSDVRAIVPPRHGEQESPSEAEIVSKLTLWCLLGERVKPVPLCNRSDIPAKQYQISVRSLEV
jgi:hypothetical protein